MEQLLAKAALWWATTPPHEKGWLITGFAAELIFASRLIVQWLASERARKSVMPEFYWYLSVLGGCLLLTYAVHRTDPVFIVGQTGGLLVYSRNIWLIWAHKRAIASSRSATETPAH